MTAFFLICLILLLAALAILLWPVRQHRRFALTVSTLFFIGAFGIYAFIGAPRLLPVLADHYRERAVIQAVLEKNAAAVKANPRDLGAWIGLGQAFIETGQYAAAANAFKQAVVLSEGAPPLILAYAKANILAENGKVNNQAKKSLEMVLLQDPKNEGARYWLIVRQLQDGKTKEAMAAMKKLYRSLPADSPLKAKIDQQIGR